MEAISFAMCERKAEVSFMEIKSAEPLIESLGAMIYVVSVQSAAFESSGERAKAWAVLRGLPAQLATIDAKRPTVEKILALPDAEGAENILFSSRGRLIVPTHPNGKLYALDLASGTLHSIPHGLAGIEFIWDVTEDREGTIYCGCWPGARLFAWQPDFDQIVDHGCVAPGEEYVRSLTSDVQRGLLYLGIGSHAQLLEYDPKTRKSQNILEERYRRESFIIRLVTCHNYLLARTREATLIYDIERGPELLCEAPPLDYCPYAVPWTRGGSSGILYFSQNRPVFFDPARRAIECFGEATRHMPRAFTVSHLPNGDESLVVLTQRGEIEVLDAAGRRLQSGVLDLPPQPLMLHYVAAGPNGKIYTSGYVVGEVGVYDPATGAREQFGGVSQSECITHDGRRIYFGTYPRAVVQVYDPALPRSSDNPRELVSLSRWGQDRPYALCADAARSVLFIGTVPDYGRLGGLLAACDIRTGHCRVWENIIEDQSIVSLVSDGKLLYGGTSTSGGLGVAPRAPSAKLFCFDIESEHLLYETIPVEGCRGITGLVCASDGMLFGWAEGVLFAFDPRSQRVVWQKLYFAKTLPADHYWRGIQMKSSPVARDLFYGAAWGEVFRFNAAASRLDIIAHIEGVEVVAPGHDGALYAIAGNQLLRLRNI